MAKRIKDKSRTWYKKAEKPDYAYILKNLHNYVHSTKDINMRLQDFKAPDLYAPGNGTWRIFWYNTHPESGELTRVQKTFNLNRIKDAQLRRHCALDHMALLSTALRRGYNYFIDTLGYTGNMQDSIRPSIAQLLTEMFAVRCNGKKERTVSTYLSYNKVFLQWLNDNNLAGLDAEMFTANHYQKFINWKVAQGHGNRNINDFTSFIKASLQIAITFEYLVTNPLAKIKALPVTDSSRFEALTAKELLLISAELIQKHIRYYIYTKFTAMEFVRPYHIAFIKAGDIDYENNLIRITAEASKNRKIKHKQLMPEMKKLLLENGYHELPGHWYLFGNRKFEPSETQFLTLSKRSAEVWRRLVINGLGIDKRMYALKHTAGQFYVNNNESLNAAWLQHHMEHSSLTETEAYIKKRQTKQLDTSTVKLIQY